MKNVLAALLFVGGSFLAGGIGGFASVNAPEFYSRLVQPAWAPPSSVFGPVWSTLYLLMGIAAFLVWRQHGWSGARLALSLFLAHLVVNALWSWFFFAWQQGIASVAEIGVLWLMVAALVFLFFRLRPISGWLLLPYLVWVTFAAALNVAMVRLNPTLLH